MVEQLNRQRVLNMLDTLYAGDIEGALARCTDDIDYLASAPIDNLGTQKLESGLEQRFRKAA